MKKKCLQLKATAWFDQVLEGEIFSCGRAIPQRIYQGTLCVALFFPI
jgi:hypothetical protein